MKTKIVNSISLSWLRHVKECQMVKSKWIPSSKWKLKNRDVIDYIFKGSVNLFRENYGYDIFKDTKNILELLNSRSIDTLGININQEQNSIYVINQIVCDTKDNLQKQDELIVSAIEKVIVSSMYIYGFFEDYQATIIIASPKISKKTLAKINSAYKDIRRVLYYLGLNYDVRLIVNQNFEDKILKPVITVVNDSCDSDENFMKVMLKYGMEKNTNLNTNISTNLNALKEMKIDVIVQTILYKMLETEKVSPEEVRLLETSAYCKKTFDIQYPLLVKTEKTNSIELSRYFLKPVKIYGNEYYVCSEWHEEPENNDRPFLLKWLEIHFNNL